MLRKLWLRCQALWRRPVALIDETRWHEVTRHYRFMQGLSAEEQRRLRLIASDFLARKHFIGAGGLEIDEIVRIQVAAQACILILELGADWFDGWTDIVIYPGRFMPEREVVDAAGVVHLTQDVLSGEAWLGGPVILSYEDVAMAGDPQQAVDGYNVVIHEFAHKLDMRNGQATGFPPLHRGMKSSAWREAFMAAYLDFCRTVDAADRRDRRRGRHAGSALDALPIDAYASENPAEFFAVISEAFFEIPENVDASYPQVYAQLCQFYRQDPLQRLDRGDIR
ncbi:MAG: zinc-dependent peptidase [Betaproteobacteria bacterium]|nr:zinc-dependent peptidase [Betaproteobacteria bacterium]